MPPVRATWSMVMWVEWVGWITWVGSVARVDLLDPPDPLDLLDLPDLHRSSRSSARRSERVPQQHSNRQRPDSSWNRRQRAGDLSDLGMHVADGQRAPLFVRFPALRSRR